MAGRAAAAEPDEGRVGDITYIRLGEPSFGYLSLLLDLNSRRIAAWEFSERREEGLVLATLREAIVSRQPGRGLIHHTDRGGQYAGKQYRAVLRRSGMQQSMSGAGNCYDNAFMESYFGTLKTELEV
ncbi:MAG: DDE-type integrase/transposase/recombinase, partial [Planctomycetaceae bacterium]|nr:DDE-type integrase/transposase/recombinase [Planctomycetaceae bacterium]